MRECSTESWFAQIRSVLAWAPDAPMALLGNFEVDNRPRNAGIRTSADIDPSTRDPNRTVTQDVPADADLIKDFTDEIGRGRRCNEIRGAITT